MRRQSAEPTDARAARRTALDALARRDHASTDLRRHLRERGYDAALVDELLLRLTAEKLLNDERYLANFIAYRAARGQGPLRVRAQLRGKGLIGEPVEQALEAFPDWIAALNQARRKKFGALPPANYQQRMREARFLGYRGFTSTQIRTALGSAVDLDE